VSERQQRDIDLLPVMDKDDDYVSFVKNRWRGMLGWASMWAGSWASWWVAYWVVRPASAGTSLSCSFFLFYFLFAISNLNSVLDFVFKFEPRWKIWCISYLLWLA
jgi:hypothetical protein